jgi:hypothetical protein
VIYLIFTSAFAFRALAVQSKASELQELEMKLQAAEHKKQEVRDRLQTKRSKGDNELMYLFTIFQLEAKAVRT